jgi:hypothetical protein
MRTSNSVLKKSTQTTNILYSDEKTVLNSGKMSLGSAKDSNSTLKNIVVGSAYTQGNVVRSLYDLNSNGPLLYNSTADDDLKIIRKYLPIFDKFPTLVDFPYLSDVSVWNADSAISDDQEFPIFKVPGKGKGDIEWYDSGSSFDGVELESGPHNMIFYENLGISTQPESKVVNNFIFPFSGKNYSGNLVQMNLEQDDPTEPYKNIKIIPYQMGRGIPQYIPGDPYFSGNSYGSPKWPLSGNEILPQLATGVVPGNNNASIGVVLDTDLAPGKTEKVYRYNSSESTILNSDWEKHSSPFTLTPGSNDLTNNPDIVSPINSSGTNYAPWSKEYAYTANQPVPIITRGQTTLRIGAAYNIGMQAYYEPEIETGDDPLIDTNKYVSIPITPLFQGEQLNTGSYVYASTMGHVITLEQEGITPYPPAIQYDLNNNPIRSAKNENPWFDWFDNTGGATGWTATPQFQLAGIPDEGVDIIETRATTPRDLPYLNQANQGSLIVQPVSIVNPADSTNGSGRMTLLGPPRYEQSTTTVSNCILNYMSKFPGAPERSQPVGTSLECIIGTGQWNYSGSSILPNTVQTGIVAGTGGYTDSTDVQTFNSTINSLIISVEITNGSLAGVPTIYAILESFSNYPKGTLFTIADSHEGPSPNGTVIRNPTSEPILLKIESNDGALLTFGIVNSGTGYSDTTGFTTFSTQITNNIPTSVDITVDSGGMLATVSIKDFGIGNSTGNILYILPVANGGMFTLNTTIDTLNIKKIKGGTNYTTYNPSTDPLNELLTDSGNIIAGYTIDISSVNGDIPTGFQLKRDTSYSIDGLDVTAFSLPIIETGSIITIKQNVVRNNMNSADSGAITPPASGWDSYVYSSNATFEQKAGKNSITVAGTNYTAGTEYTATNGSETFPIKVYTVSSTGGVASVGYYGPSIDGFPFNTSYTISGGDNNAEITLGVFDTETYPGFSKGPANYLTNQGSGYVTSTNVSTFNISSNSLFVFAKVSAGVIETLYDYDPASSTGQIEMPLRNSVDDSLTYIDLSRYSVADSIRFYQNSTETINCTFELDTIEISTSILEMTKVSDTANFATPPNSDYAFFPTRNLTETQTIVDIVADTNGNITSVVVTSVGDRLRYGDFLMVEAGNSNFVFQFIPEIDVPPPFIPAMNNRAATATEWNTYRTVMKSAINLLNESLIIDFNPMYPNYFNNSYYWFGDGGTTKYAT